MGTQWRKRGREPCDELNKQTGLKPAAVAHIQLRDDRGSWASKEESRCEWDISSIASEQVQLPAVEPE